MPDRITHSFRYLAMTWCLCLANGHAPPAVAFDDVKVDALLSNLEHWFEQNETIKYTCKTSRFIRGGFFGDEETQTGSVQYDCVRFHKRWRIRSQESLVLVEGGHPISGASGMELALITDFRIRVQLGEEGVIEGINAALASDKTNFARVDPYLNESGFIHGFVGANGDQSLLQLLRGSSPKTYEASGDEIQPGTVAIQARGDHGRFIVWIDADDGSPRKVVIEKSGANSIGDGRLLSQVGSREEGRMFPAEFRTRQVTTFDSIKYQHGDGAPVLKSFRQVDEIWFDRGSQVRMTANVVYDNVSRLESADDSEFIPQTRIPNHTRVSVLGHDGVEHEWIDGAVVERFDPVAARRHAQSRFIRGYRSPWYVATVVGLLSLLAALLVVRAVRAARS